MDIREMTTDTSRINTRPTRVHRRDVIPAASWEGPPTAAYWDTDVGKQTIQKFLVKYLGHQLPRVDPHNMPRAATSVKLWYTIQDVLMQLEYPPSQHPTQDQVLYVVNTARDRYQGRDDPQFSQYWEHKDGHDIIWLCMNRRPKTENI